MAEFEEQLNAILGDPGAMGQIMALAQSLQKGMAGPEAPPPSAGASGTPSRTWGCSPT